jgi:hypothetical protein
MPHTNITQDTIKQHISHDSNNFELMIKSIESISPDNSNLAEQLKTIVQLSASIKRNGKREGKELYIRNKYGKINYANDASQEYGIDFDLIEAIGVMVDRNDFSNFSKNYSLITEYLKETLIKQLKSVTNAEAKDATEELKKLYNNSLGNQDELNKLHYLKKLLFLTAGNTYLNAINKELQIYATQKDNIDLSKIEYRYFYSRVMAKIGETSRKFETIIGKDEGIFRVFKNARNKIAHDIKFMSETNNVVNNNILKFFSNKLYSQLQDQVTQMLSAIDSCNLGNSLESLKIEIVKFSTEKHNACKVLMETLSDGFVGYYIPILEDNILLLEDNIFAQRILTGKAIVSNSFLWDIYFPNYLSKYSLYANSVNRSFALLSIGSDSIELKAPQALQKRTEDIGQNNKILSAVFQVIIDGLSNYQKDATKPADDAARKDKNKIFAIEALNTYFTKNNFETYFLDKRNAVLVEILTKTFGKNDEYLKNIEKTFGKNEVDLEMLKKTFGKHKAELEMLEKTFENHKAELENLQKLTDNFEVFKHSLLNNKINENHLAILKYLMDFFGRSGKKINIPIPLKYAKNSKDTNVSTTNNTPVETTKKPTEDKKTDPYARLHEYLQSIEEQINILVSLEKNKDIEIVISNYAKEQAVINIGQLNADITSLNLDINFNINISGDLEDAMKEITGIRNFLMHEPLKNTQNFRATIYRCALPTLDEIKALNKIMPYLKQIDAKDLTNIDSAALFSIAKSYGTINNFVKAFEFLKIFLNKENIITIDQDLGKSIIEYLDKAHIKIPDAIYTCIFLSAIFFKNFADIQLKGNNKELAEIYFNKAITILELLAKRSHPILKAELYMNLSMINSGERFIEHNLTQSRKAFQTYVINSNKANFVNMSYLIANVARDYFIYNNYVGKFTAHTIKDKKRFSFNVSLSLAAFIYARDLHLKSPKKDAKYDVYLLTSISQLFLLKGNLIVVNDYLKEIKELSKNIIMYKNDPLLSIIENLKIMSNKAIDARQTKKNNQAGFNIETHKSLSENKQIVFLDNFFTAIGSQFQDSEHVLARQQIGDSSSLSKNELEERIKRINHLHEIIFFRNKISHNNNPQYNLNPGLQDITILKTPIKYLYGKISELNFNTFRNAIKILMSGASALNKRYTIDEIKELSVLEISKLANIQVPYGHSTQGQINGDEGNVAQAITAVEAGPTGHGTTQGQSNGDEGNVAQAITAVEAGPAGNGTTQDQINGEEQTGPVKNITPEGQINGEEGNAAQAITAVEAGPAGNGTTQDQINGEEQTGPVKNITPEGQSNGDEGNIAQASDAAEAGSEGHGNTQDQINGDEDNTAQAITAVEAGSEGHGNTQDQINGDEGNVAQAITAAEAGLAVNGLSTINANDMPKNIPRKSTHAQTSNAAIGVAQTSNAEDDSSEYRQQFASQAESINTGVASVKVTGAKSHTDRLVESIQSSNGMSRENSR